MRVPNQPVVKPDGEESPDKTGKRGRADRQEQLSLPIKSRPTPAHTAN